LNGLVFSGRGKNSLGGKGIGSIFNLVPATQGGKGVTDAERKKDAHLSSTWLKAKKKVSERINRGTYPPFAVLGEGKKKKKTRRPLDTRGWKESHSVSLLIEQNQH